MDSDAQSPDISSLPPSTPAPTPPPMPDGEEDLPITLPKDICPDPMKVGDTIELTVDSIDPDTGDYAVSYHTENEDASEDPGAEEKALGYKRPKAEKETPNMSAKDLES